MEYLIGKTLNRYSILTLLGKGGIGAVYRARDTVLQRDVAIKVLSPEYARRTNFQDRFLQEARAAARLDHPSIVRLHDFGRANLRGEGEIAASPSENSFLYIVMEYIPGDNLRKMLNDLRAGRQWVILPEAVQIVQQIAEALEYAHRQGVLHLDIKPSNLMLKPSANDPEKQNSLPYRVVVTDLGLAQLAGSETAEREGGSMGTPAYMSPEQTLGQKIDARSDVYSLGVLLYELAVGRVPFPARTIEEAARYHTHEQPPKPRSIRPDLPAALEQVILKALQKDPDRRYDSAGQLDEALEAIIPAITEVAFRPDEDTQTISLITQYENTVADEPLSPERRRASGRATGRMSQDYVEIVLPDQTVRAVPMQPDGLAIGRDADNEIVLDNVKVSRQHARIQLDGDTYWISDLNSKNGTYVGGRRLVPGEPVKWPAGQEVQIGDFKLRLRQSGGENIPAPRYPVSSAGEAETAAFATPPRTPSGDGRVGLFMETVQLSVTPGNSVSASVVLVNQGTATDQYRISISGIPANWVPNPPPVLRLPPGAQQELDITIHPPLSPHTRPGRYPVTVRASSQEAAGRTAEVEAILTVGVYSQFTSELRPRQVWSDAAIHVSVQNGGNARQSFTITAADRADEIVFDPPQAQASLAEGEAATVDFQAAPRRPRIFGGSRSHPFNVQVATPGGDVQTHNGEVFTSGLIPLWVLPVLLIVCLCATALAAYGYIDVLQGPARARLTAQAGTQAVFLTQTAVKAAEIEATLRAITATSTATAVIPNTDTPTPTQTPTNTPVTPTPAIPTNTNTPVVIVITATSPPASATFTVARSSPTVTETSPPQITPTPLGGSRLVVFASNRDGNYEVYAMLNDGTRQTRVTNNGTDDRDPSLSNSGLRTVFTANRDGNDEIYVMNVDGSDQKRLTSNDTSDTSPAWSPDGNRIVFVSERDGNKEIYVMNADGTGQTRLTVNDVDDDNPSWSPDGGRIVFDRAVEEGRHIYLMDASGGNAVALVENTATNQTPVFSPDGARIAYVSNVTGSMEIYVMNANGSGQSQLTNLAMNAHSPNWSNDGTYLVFESRINDLGDIYRVEAGGGNAVNLTNNTVDDHSPTW